MQIDWFTTIAQIINFLILLWLLKKFLYRPIINTMDNRQKQVAQRWEEAEDTQARAEERAAEFRKRQDEIEQEREAILEQTRQEAAEHRKQLMEEARADAERLQRQWAAAIEEQREAFVRSLGDTYTSQVSTAVRSALEELADSQLEKQMVRALTEKVRTMDDADIKPLASGENIVVGSSSRLPDNLRSQLESALRERLGQDSTIEFETTNDISCGLEIHSGGRRIAWTLDSYVEGLRQSMDEAISSHRATEEAPEAREQVESAPPEKAHPATDEQEAKASAS